jgi:DASH complex subunit DAD2
MSFPTKSFSSHMRQPSLTANAASTGQSPALIARVNEKKAELENLKELRDLSAAVASQMEALEQKLATLSDGTEGRSWTSRTYISNKPNPDTNDGFVLSNRVGRW